MVLTRPASALLQCPALNTGRKQTIRNVVRPDSSFADQIVLRSGHHSRSVERSHSALHREARSVSVIPHGNETISHNISVVIDGDQFPFRRLGVKPFSNAERYKHMSAISRVDFLRGDLKGRREPVRPPWAADGRTFSALCDGCGDCIRACGPAIIIAGRGGMPEVDFRRGACTFCGDCVTACPSGALSQVKMPLVPPWSLVPEIDETCLAKRGVVCRTCGDRCEPRAIRFHLAPGGVSQPDVTMEDCTGCGDCVAACPGRSITMTPNTVTYAEISSAAKGALA